MVVGSDEVLEEAPGSPRDQPEATPLGFRQRSLVRDGHAIEASRNPGRQQPPQENRRSHRKRPRARERDDRGEGECEGGATKQPQPSTSQQDRSPRMRGGDPFQQPSVAHDRPPEGSRDRIQLGGGSRGQERDRDAGPRRQQRERTGTLSAGHEKAASGAARHDAQRERENRQRHDQQGPPGGSRKDEPARDREQEQGRREEAAPQIVEDFPSIQGREPVLQARSIRRRHACEQPAGDLPVSPHPAVQAMQPGEHGLGVVLEYDDVGDQPGPSVDAFEQVVTQDSVLRYAPAQRPLEGGDFVDPLARVDPLTEQVLIEIGDGMGVEVQARIALLNPGERRPSRPRHRLDPRLQHGVAGAYAAIPPEPGTVQRVSERAHESPNRALRDERIGVQGDHVASTAERRGVALGHEGVARLSLDQAAELDQLPALPLPPHPPPLGRVPAARPMNQHERAVSGSAVSSVQTPDLRAREREQRRVLLLPLYRGVREVSEKREADGGIVISEESQLEARDVLADLRFIEEQHGHRYDGVEGVGDPVTELELRKHLRGNDPHHHPIHQCGGRSGRRQEQEQHRPEERRSRCGQGQGQCQHEGESEDAAHVQRQPEPRQSPRDATADWRATVEPALQGLPSVTSQVVSDVSFHAVRIRRFPGQLHGAGRDGHLVVARPARELLDYAAVPIASLEVHRSIGLRRVQLQRPMHAADRLEERLPVQHVEQPKALDRRRNTPGLAGVGRPPGTARNRRLAASQAADEFGRRPGQLFEQDQPQHRGERPQLGRGQQRAVLIRAKGFLHVDGIRAPVARLEERPGQGVCPGLPALSARPQCGQPSEECPGHRFRCSVERRPDDVGVVQQPLGLANPLRGGDARERGEVGFEPCLQPAETSPHRMLRSPLC